MTAVVHVRWAGLLAAESPQAAAQSWLDRTERGGWPCCVARPTVRGSWCRGCCSSSWWAKLSAVDPVSVRLPTTAGSAVSRTESLASQCLPRVRAGRSASPMPVAGSPSPRPGPVRWGSSVEPVDGVRFEGFDAVALSERESAALAHLPPAERDQARASAWVRKEAVAQGDGAGTGPRPGDRRPGGVGPARTVLDLAVGDGYAAAVAVLTPGPVRLEVVEVSERARSRPAGPGAPARPASRAAAG